MVCQIWRLLTKHGGYYNMLASQLVAILNDYIRSYGDQFVTVADENYVLGDADSVMLTNFGEFAITYTPDRI